MAAGAVKQEQWVVHVVVVIAVEERQLLSSVRLVIGGVDVEDHLGGVRG
jgi:hypothetical protein